jgi:hypothetical protein
MITVGIVGAWLPDRLSTRKEHAAMAWDRSDSPAESGRAWAEDKADRLRGVIAARDWPDAWERGFDGRLRLPEEVSESEAHAYRESAHHAAAARWLELCVEQRDAEAADEADVDSEREAERMLAFVRSALPQALSAERDGAGVFVSDGRGEEITVTSLAEAFRVVSDYDDRYTR